MITRSSKGKTALFLPACHYFLIFISDISGIIPNKMPGITTIKNTHSNKIHTGKLITKISEKKVRKRSTIIPVFFRKLIDISSLTVTKIGIILNIISSQIRLSIIPVSFEFPIILQRSCFTISQNYTLDFLKFMFFLKMRKNLM